MRSDILFDEIKILTKILVPNCNFEVTGAGADNPPPPLCTRTNKITASNMRVFTLSKSSTVDVV